MTESRAKTERSRTKGRLREKAPEIVVEALSVVFAVLLALAVDEWRDHRANAQVAGQAQERILAEVRANLAELRSHGDENRGYLESLQAALSTLDRHPEGTGGAPEIPVRYTQSILSSSAWDTARVTGVLRFLDFDWVSSLSRVYEVQNLFLGHQAVLVESIAGFDDDAVDREASLGRLRNRMQTAMAYHDGLVEEYERVLPP